MNIIDELDKNIKDSFCESTHDKLIYISGYLANDTENIDILNFVNYLLYSERKPRSSFLLNPSFSFESIRDMCQGDNDD